MQIHVCVYICMYTYIYIYIYVYTYTCIHIYIYILIVIIIVPGGPTYQIIRKASTTYILVNRCSDYAYI